MAPRKTSSTKINPRIASPAPTNRRGAGRVRVRAQCQPINSTGAEYSSSNATPTETYCTALK